MDMQWTDIYNLTKYLKSPASPSKAFDFSILEHYLSMLRIYLLEYLQPEEMDGLV